MKIRLIDTFAKLELKRDEQLQVIKDVIGEYKSVKDLSDAEIQEVLMVLEARLMTDNDYDKLLERLVKGAEYLERTELSPAQRKKAQKLYDEIKQRVKAYKRGGVYGGQDQKRG